MDDMTCADFSAMDAHGRMEAVTAMEGDMAAGGGMMAAGEAMMAADDTAPDEKTEAVTTACAEHPDMMLGDAMKGDGRASSGRAPAPHRAGGELS